ncbi:hypothetical protein SAMN04487947_0580 [Halogeometricum rufum]|uniref:Uncharacterized protein n=1 Tax=Halogeometricum rufum TaxID=553469 RepID=A0A1I6G4V3_9EURY|nr:hypothetical protein [Halogeometricum rufum]SFR37243.1 hypothetical protein SAMN04487947_0580 [Halogeometricum rufum]
MVCGEPITVVTNGVAWYTDAGSDATVRHEGRIELYDAYVRLCDPVGASWVPRENVEMVSEV